MLHRLVIAAGIFVCLSLPWFARVHLFDRHGSKLDYLAWSVVLASSFAVTTFARDHRFVAGLLVAVPAGVLAVAAHLVRQFLGYPVDFAGASGALLAFQLILIGFFILAAIGAGLASLVACLHKRLSSASRVEDRVLPNSAARLVSLFAFGMVGAALGFIVHLFIASRVGYIAVPICLALGLCLANDPSFWSRRRVES